MLKNKAFASMSVNQDEDFLKHSLRELKVEFAT